MARSRKTPRVKKPLTADEREALGKWAKRVSQSVSEFEKEAGKTVKANDLLAWQDLSEEDRELYRKGGEAIAGGSLRSEQAMWDQLALIRAEMGEKAFRKKIFSICIDIAVEGLAPHLSELDRYKAVESIVGLSGMLEVPEEEGSNRADA
jgi:hypothetical protein